MRQRFIYWINYNTSFAPLILRNVLTRIHLNHELHDNQSGAYIIKGLPIVDPVQRICNLKSEIGTYLESMYMKFNWSKKENELGYALHICIL